MSTSGVTTFNLTNDELVKAALRKLAVLGDGQDPSAFQLANGKQALNVMLKTFQTKGMPLWAIAEYDVPMTATRVYPLTIPAPLKVIQALRIDADGNTTELDQKGHMDYNRLPGTGEGTPTSFWYEPNGILHIWPTPSDTTQTVRIVYQRQVYDMVSSMDNVDFPTYWLEAVIYGLAHRLGPEFGIPLQDRGQIAKEAQYFLDEALSFGTEEGSISFSPDWVGR